MAYVDSLRSKGPLLLVDAGDYSHPTLTSGEQENWFILRAMGRMRYDAMTLGELELSRAATDGDSFCVANLSYVYNHHQRDLTERLTEAQHAHHDLVVATTHVHLDHDNCLETVILKGRTAVVRAFAQGIEAERGVRHGQLNVVTVDTDDRHRGFKARTHAGHMHFIPRS